MVQSPLLDSFDPFATHPFTNNSGVVAQPPMPSIYPLLVPSSFVQSTGENTYSNLATLTSPIPISRSTKSSTQNSSSPMHSPQPQRYHSPSSSPTTPTSPTRHVFVPFRKDTSSPDLVLKKKSPSYNNS
ncbi:hypothetical protein BDZ97DRAFT_1610119, partial [Flammula alnicola]